MSLCSVFCFVSFPVCIPKYFNYSEKKCKLFNFKDEGEGGGGLLLYTFMQIE